MQEDIIVQIAAKLNDRGLKFYELGDLAKAIELLSKAIKINPAAALPHYNRGNAHLASKSYELAITDFTEALRLSPSFVMALSNRGSAYSSLNRFDEALRDFDSAFAIEAENKYVLYYL